MRDILNEAILFNTYYAEDGKDSTSGPVAVNSKTPRFQDFYISNIFCNNARAAIAITGLPEMPANHIYMSDMVISAKTGFSAVDAEDISLKNVKLISPASTLIGLNNARNMTFSNIGFNGNTSTFISASGNTTGVKVTDTNLKGLAEPLKLDKPLDKSTVTIQ